jgi:glycosyltransferase involved in cell wall biosynthesis
MRYFDRSQLQVNVALTSSEADAPDVSAKRHVEKIPDLTVLPTNFGYSREGRPGAGKLIGGMAQTTVSMAKVVSFIRKQKIQIVHGTEKPRDAFYGVLLGKLTGARSVVHMHVSYGDWLSSPVKWALRQADAILTVSPFSAKSIADAGYPAERVHTVLNSLDLSSSRWNPTGSPLEIRRNLGIPDKAVVLGVVSRLFLYKGHRDLLEALATVKQSMPDYRLVIVGEDDPRAHPGGGSFTAELKSLAAKHGISDNVIFTGFRTDIPALMNSFDIYTMPSWEEPFGMVYLEAMSMYKPVVAWKLAGPEEIVVDGETGFLVPPKDVGSLGKAILALSQDSEMRRRFGQAGRRRVEEKFSSQRMCSDVLSVYHQLLSRNA